MKYIVTHASPDLDAITSVWLIKRFLQGWEDAHVQFVPAGEKLQGDYQEDTKGEVVEIVEGLEVIHVDTGLGALDHHQTNDQNICAARLTYDYVTQQKDFSKREAREAVRRMVEVVVDNDHFQEVFYKDTLSHYQEFSLEGILDGLRLERRSDSENVEFVMNCLDAILHTFEPRVWAEKEIVEKGREFNTKWGKGIAFETSNDGVLKLAQKMGYVIAVRKDPHNGFVRIKARPRNRSMSYESRIMEGENADVDLTSVYEKLRKLDPNATWFLHVSKGMLLNGSSKNPKMKGTKLTLLDIITVLLRVG